MNKFILTWLILKGSILNIYAQTMQKHMNIQKKRAYTVLLLCIYKHPNLGNNYYFVFQI